MKRFIKGIVGVVALGLLILLVMNIFMDDFMSKIADKDLVITHEGGFYRENFKIQAFAGSSGEIYYTTDCSEPVPDADNTHRYEKPIRIEVTQEQQIFTYRFKAYYTDGTQSPVYTHTYFTGKAIEERYTTLVLSLTGEEEELFGYEEGIFVRGRRWDEYMAANPNVDILGTVIPANYHQDVERAVSIELFEPTGTRVFGQNGGVKIAGAVSRAKNQKSFRLYARKEYDTQNEFRYAFFPQHTSETDGTVIDKFRRLVVRNSGNDNGYGFIRNELTGILAGQAGFPDVQLSKSVSVYINGKYQGVYWLQNHFDQYYFETKYGAHTGRFAVLEGGDSLMKSEDAEEEDLKYVGEYNDICADISGKEPGPADFTQLEDKIDIKNYLEYCAIHNYVANIDWPENNCKVYRYVSEDGEYIDGSVFDGRYRYLLYDTDYAFGLLFQGNFGIPADSYTLYRIANKGTFSPLFSSVITNREYRDYFVNYTCDLMNGAMSYDSVSSELERLNGERDQELRYMMEETDILKGSLWESDSLSMADVERELNTILEFARIRPEAVIRDIQSVWEDVGNAYTLQVTANSFSEISVNSLILNKDFSGQYFEDIPVLLKPVIHQGYEFVCWYLNGQSVTSEELEVNRKDVLSGKITVSLEVKERQEAQFSVTEIKTKGANDYIVLTNVGTAAAGTDSIYVSDDDNHRKTKLPLVQVKAGESVILYGSKNTQQDGIRLDFSLSQGETLTLYDETEGILEQIVIPRLHAEESIYIRNPETGLFYEKLPEEEQEQAAG